MSSSAGSIGKHPLLDSVARALRQAPDGSLLFAPDELGTVQQRALAIDSGAELFLLVQELLRFAAYLERNAGSPGAAASLVEMSEPVMARLEERAKADARNEAEQADAARRAASERAPKPNRSRDGLRPSPKAGVSLRRRRPMGG